jgi:outer membrane receptor protein involved in Fe transport
MSKRIGLRIICLVMCMSFALAGFAVAGTTGKITGRVFDQGTGVALPGVNVIITGTSMGAASNLNGEYFILNVPVGTYTMTASMMGYTPLAVQNVQVSADLTVIIDFPLEETQLDIVKEVVVVAERPIVERDVTSSSTRLSGSDIERMPVTTFTDVVANQAGAVETGGAFSGGLHIRGGRDNEVVYVVDGVVANDPVYMQRGVNIETNAIAEMSVISGGFNAEYGEAMSGIVNIITKEGTPNYGGTIEYTTDFPFDGSRYDYGTNKVEFSFGGPVPALKSMMFFVSSAVDDRKDRDPGIVPKPHNDLYRQSGTAKLSWKPANTLKMTLGGNWANTEWHSYSHSRSKGNWLKDSPLSTDGNLQVNLATTHTINQSTFWNLNLSYFNTYRTLKAQDGKSYLDWRAIGGGLPWVDWARSQGRYVDVTNADGEVEQVWEPWYNVATQEWSQRWDPDLGEYVQLDPQWVWEHFYTEIANEGEGYAFRDSLTGELEWTFPVWEQEAMNNRWYDTGEWQIQGDEVVYVPFDLDAYLFEVANSPEHKSDLYNGDIHNFYGHDWDYYTLTEYPGLGRLNPPILLPFYHFRYDFVPWYHDRETTFYTADFSITSQINKTNQLKAGGYFRRGELDLTDMQFLNRNPYSDSYHKEPVYAAAYAQDKFEFEDLTINAGMRFDYFDPRADHFIDLDSLDLGTEPVDAKYEFSPRLGISFAVTDKSVMYASYGHFFQPVELGELFQSLNVNVTTGRPLIGNPDLPPQKTVAYQIGLKYAFTPDVAGEITAYFKDVTDLLATRQLNTLVQDNPTTIDMFIIEDFAVIKGIDVTLSKRASEFLSGTITYSYLNAQGTGSSPREGYYIYSSSTTPIPKREYPLEFDVTHSLKTNVNLYMPPDFGPQLWFFKPLSDLNANVQFNFNSGPPYTPEDSRGNPSPDVGSRRMPSTQTTDLRVDKIFNIGDLISYGFFLDVRNLFDRENVVDVYNNTGLADDNGNRPDPAGWLTTESYQAALENWQSRFKNPSYYSNPRIIRLGATLMF